MVIMMNPGSSKPVKDLLNREVETIPDNTQCQIMKVMCECDFSYARILNLSDLREPKSSAFYKAISKMEKQTISHSVFDECRVKDFNKLFEKNVRVIFAWGVNKKLISLAQTATKKMNVKNPVGIEKENFEYAYYHPLPRSHEKQKDWVKQIVKKLKS